jgi:hypothetical protein
LAAAHDNDLAPWATARSSGGDSGEGVASGRVVGLKVAELKRLRRALLKEGFVAPGGGGSGRSGGSGGSGAEASTNGTRSYDSYTSSSGDSTYSNGDGISAPSEPAYCRGRERFAAGGGWGAESAADYAWAAAAAEEAASVAGPGNSWGGGGSSSNDDDDASWQSYGSLPATNRDSSNSSSSSSSSSGLRADVRLFGATADAAPATSPLHAVLADPGLDAWIGSSASQGGGAYATGGGSEAPSVGAATRSGLRLFAPGPLLAVQLRRPHAAVSNGGQRVYSVDPRLPSTDRRVRWKEEVAVRTIPHRTDDPWGSKSPEE